MIFFSFWQSRVGFAGVTLNSVTHTSQLKVFRLRPIKVLRFHWSHDPADVKTVFHDTFSDRRPHGKPFSPVEEVQLWHTEVWFTSLCDGISPMDAEAHLSQCLLPSVKAKVLLYLPHDWLYLVAFDMHHCLYDITDGQAAETWKKLQPVNSRKESEFCRSLICCIASSRARQGSECCECVETSGFEHHGCRSGMSRFWPFCLAAILGQTSRERVQHQADYGTTLLSTR